MEGENGRVLRQSKQIRINKSVFFVGVGVISFFFAFHGFYFQRFGLSIPEGTAGKSVGKIRINDVEMTMKRRRYL